MLKALEAIGMVVCGLCAFGRALLFVHHGMVKIGWMTLVALPPTVDGVPTEGEPTPVAVSGRDLFLDALRLLVWGGLAAWLGVRVFA